MKIRSIVLLTVISVLSACSSKFAYNNMDWLLYWYLDDYVELEGAQKEAFDGKLDDWLKWHRTEELAKYKAQLIDLQQAVNAGSISAEEWLEVFDRGREHWIRLREYLAPQLMPFASALTDEQVESLFAKLESQDVKRQEKRAKKTAEKREEDALEETLEQLKDRVGRLQDTQKQLVASYHKQFETNFDNWMQYRRDIRAAARELFEQRHTAPDFQQQLLYLLNHPEDYQSDELKRVSTSNRLLNAQMLEALSASLTSKQKRKFSKEMQELIDDLTDLIEDA